MKRTRLGLSFGETLISESRRPKEMIGEMPAEVDQGKSRANIFLAIFVGGLILLVGRVFWLTVVRGPEYWEMADQNRIRQEVIRAPRGLILDRHGEKLTQNIPIFRVQENDEKGNLKGYKVIDRDEAIRLELSGLTFFTDPGRSYPLSQAAAHVVGYVSQVNSDELRNPVEGCQRNPLVLGDFVGRGGIEDQYDCVIRGRNGEKVLETDTTGREVRVLGQVQPVAGNDLKTTLDARLQQVAYTALGGKDGAVVVMEASTGAVLAMVSSPSFDPGMVAQVLNNPSSPLLDRALGGAYPAGSVFKLAVASAALSEGKISPTFTIDDPGVISVGGLSFSNWFYSEYGRKEGVVDVVRALARSTDTFFYQVGGLTGPDLMAQWAQRLGMGKVTGIDVPGEVGGLIPTPSWKIKDRGEPWYLGNTYNMAIGQGDVLVTPLQVAQMTQAIANDGVLCRPSVILGSLKKCQDIGLSENVRRLVVLGMVGACSPGGTAFPLFGFKPQVACKTGTAQFGIEGKLTHAWLTAFAPADRPQIVVTALVEGGGEGSAIAAPVAKAVLTEWFKK